MLKDCQKQQGKDGENIRASLVLTDANQYIKKIRHEVEQCKALFFTLRVNRLPKYSMRKLERW